MVERWIDSNMSKSKKPKFKMTRQELLEFNDAATQIYEECPQTRGTLFEDRDILLGNVTAKEVYKGWKDCKILHDYGYLAGAARGTKSHLYLAYETYKEVEKKYQLYKARKILWKEENS